MALRVGALADSNLAARRLSVYRVAVYATPDYDESCLRALDDDTPLPAVGRSGQSNEAP